jgi:hypothetical protein
LDLIAGWGSEVVERRRFGTAHPRIFAERHSMSVALPFDLLQVLQAGARLPTE